MVKLDDIAGLSTAKTPVIEMFFSSFLFPLLAALFAAGIFTCFIAAVKAQRLRDILEMISRDIRKAQGGGYPETYVNQAAILARTINAEAHAVSHGFLRLKPIKQIRLQEIVDIINHIRKIHSGEIEKSNNPQVYHDECVKLALKRVNSFLDRFSAIDFFF